MHHRIKVKVLRETKRKVILRFINLNRKMPIDKPTFQERVKMGIYEVINPRSVDEK